ncbi:MAG TPA: YdeI/OmpD-associated family protein [Gemmatimonadaceae bacterium]|nr:YdeI/OmpD-associated family protein [Gemmatimonadaceae bacterium]
MAKRTQPKPRLTPATPATPATADGVRFFATPEKWRQWLEKNHARADEVWVGFHRRSTGIPSITWSEAVDEALCYGWIDGIRKTIDETRYKNRFTPRRKGSNWSKVNIAKVAALTKEGRMRPSGLAAFEGATSRGYTHEQRGPVGLGEEYERRFRTNAKAWAWFEAQAPYYRKLATRWVTEAKQEATRERRLALLIEDSAAGRRIGPMRRPGIASRGPGVDQR